MAAALASSTNALALSYQVADVPAPYRQCDGGPDLLCHPWGQPYAQPDWDRYQYPVATH